MQGSQDSVYLPMEQPWTHACHSSGSHQPVCLLTEQTGLSTPYLATRYMLKLLDNSYNSTRTIHASSHEGQAGDPKRHGYWLVILQVSSSVGCWLAVQTVATTADAIPALPNSSVAQALALALAMSRKVS
ncbi:hypothetical protein N5P37_010349 [Trichoderma harzianum]|nr:hypothetical protein N5P37_010349 [Trichoderma harzianum]